MLELQRYSNVSALFFFQNGGKIQRYVKEWKAITMDVLKMLGELRHEREQIEEAILTLERLIQGRTKRRGRPPAWMATVKRRGRPPGSKNKVKEIAAA
jgi:hypothetical protein